ncbi:MAG TPA: hypothetical protein PKM25_13055, partial [Candidatus Ozemobacteraceae bacterium]|nr:hypothetical protein [Candidatus Ozemobacteraceae bacterium]
MQRGQRSELRYLAFLTAFFCSMFFSGCGTGSDGGGNPAGILPTGQVTGGVEGYVSRATISGNLKASVGTALSTPFADASVQLIALDSSNGSEQILGTGRTDDHGYYQITYSNTSADNRNLLLRAVKGSDVSEGVLPMLKQGIVVRAQTINPNSSVTAKILRQLGKVGKSSTINLGELTAMMPAETLESLENGISTIVNSLIAREEARKLRFGSRLDELSAAAFEVQQSVEESVEKGELSAEEARIAFIRKLEERARAIGFTSEELSALDDYDNAFLYKPIMSLFSGCSDEAREEVNFETNRLRESKRNTLSLVSDSVTMLVGEKSRTEYAAFYQLIEKMRQMLDEAATPADIRDVFAPDSDQMKEFTTSLGNVLLSIDFTPELVAEVFSMQTPRLLDTGAADGISKTASPGNISNYNPSSLVRQQGRIIGDLTEAVRHVAEKAALSLTEDQLKAIALLLWAKAPEKLDFTVAMPASTEPASPLPPPGELNQQTGIIRQLQSRGMAVSGVYFLESDNGAANGALL